MHKLVKWVELKKDHHHHHRYHRYNLGLPQLTRLVCQFNCCTCQLSQQISIGSIYALIQRDGIAYRGHLIGGFPGLLCRLQRNPVGNQVDCGLCT